MLLTSEASVGGTLILLQHGIINLSLIACLIIQPSAISGNQNASPNFESLFGFLSWID
jgi:hypothetical protein